MKDGEVLASHCVKCCRMLNLCLAFFSSPRISREPKQRLFVLCESLGFLILFHQIFSAGVSGVGFDFNSLES